MTLDTIPKGAINSHTLIRLQRSNCPLSRYRGLERRVVGSEDDGVGPRSYSMLCGVGSGGKECQEGRKEGERKGRRKESVGENTMSFPKVENIQLQEIVIIMNSYLSVWGV